MKLILVFVLSIFTTAYVNASEIPAAILALSTKHKVSIKEYLYEHQSLYMIDSRDKCCDLGASVYDQIGSIFCRYVGIAGAWESKCSDFDKKAKFIKTIKADNDGT